MYCLPRRYGVRQNPIAQSVYSKIVAWYEMDESSGTTMIDSHINGLNGTYSGITVNQTGLASNLNKAVLHNGGTTNYAEVPDNAVLDLSGNLSCMTWVKRNGAQTLFPKLLWKPNGNLTKGNANYQIYYDSSLNKVLFRVTHAGVNQNAVPSITMTNNTVYCIVGTRNATSLKIWIDGVERGVGTCSASPIDTTTDNLRIGYAILTTHDAWAGWQDQTAIFNDALTADEIAYLYGGGAGVSYSRLRADAGL